VQERLATLLEIFSPWDGISLTYRQFAAELGEPVTQAAVKKWRSVTSRWMSLAASSNGQPSDHWWA
jgi:hypothetical protein